jgi:hypothetical protein
VGSPVASKLESVKVHVDELLLAIVLVKLLAHVAFTSNVLIVALLLAAAEHVLEASRHDSVVRRCHGTFALYERVLIEVAQDEATQVGCQSTVQVTQPSSSDSRRPRWSLLHNSLPRCVHLARSWLQAL